MNNQFTEKLAMLAGIEVKPSAGNEVEAQGQLALWLAAGLRCREQLIQSTKRTVDSMDGFPLFGWTVFGHEWKLYLAFADADEERAVVSCFGIAITRLYVN